jgi:isovaleryl-CoA dehydrogenase
MTNYHSSEQEIREVIQTVRAFAAKELAPYADELDREERLAPGIFRRLGELGILGLTVAEEFGGAKLGAVAVVAVMEELSYACPGTCLSYLAHALLFVHNLAQNASPEQLIQYLPRAITGEIVGGMAMTEPGVGSDAIGMMTRATKNGDHYLLNGAKMFITNGPIGDVFLVYARTGDQLLSLNKIFLVFLWVKSFLKWECVQVQQEN